MAESDKGGGTVGTLARLRQHAIDTGKNQITPSPSSFLPLPMAELMAAAAVVAVLVEVIDILHAVKTNVRRVAVAHWAVSQPPFP